MRKFSRAQAVLRQLLVLAFAAALFGAPRKLTAQDSKAAATRQVANALLLQLIGEAPPRERVVCIKILVGSVRPWKELDIKPTVDYLRTRGIVALDGSECGPVPPPADSTGDWRRYGQMIHLETSRLAAAYNVRVVEVRGDRATLVGEYSFNKTHGASCPYEGHLENGRWKVMLPPGAVCLVA